MNYNNRFSAAVISNELSERNSEAFCKVTIRDNIVLLILTIQLISVVIELCLGEGSMSLLHQ